MAGQGGWTASTGGIQRAEREEERNRALEDYFAISKNSMDLSVNKKFLRLPSLK